LLFLTWLALRKKLVGLYNQGWLKERERERRGDQGREWGVCRLISEQSTQVHGVKKERRREEERLVLFLVFFPLPSFPNLFF
jgi:hypothetical protein